MKIPEIKIENHQKIYEHLRDYKQNPKFMRRWYAFHGNLLNPRVRYAKGARKDLDLIRDKDYHHIYVTNHRGDSDGYILSAILHKVAPTDAGRVRLLTHSMGFESVFARLCRNLGTIPVFLKIYYTTSKRHKNHPERLAFVPEAAESMIDCLVAVMTEHRQKIFILPEGAFNLGAPDTLLPIRKGTAVVAHRVARIDGPVAITPIGIAYGKKKRRFDIPFNASLYVERPIFVESGMTVDEITEQVDATLLSSVKEAVKRY